MLYNAFTNLDNAIAAVEANSVTTTALDDVFKKYFASGGGENVWYWIKQVDSDLKSQVGLLSGTVSQATKAMQDLYGMFYNFNFTVPSADGSMTMGRFTHAFSDFAKLVYDLSVMERTLISSVNDRLGAEGRIYDATGGYSGYMSLQASLGALSKLIYDTSTTGNSSLPYLSGSGRASAGAYLTSPQLLRNGLLGLSYNLVGGDQSTTFSLVVPNDGEEGGVKTEEKQVDNLLDALGLLGTSLQNPLAKLQYVLADDDDIRLKDKTQPNKDAIEDNFTGDGPGAVNPGQIGDIGDISSSAGDAFGGAGSAGDAFIAITDSNSYSFFSQAVSDALDTVCAVSAQSDEDFMEGFELGDDGFYHVKDTSAWDVTAFLGG